MVPTGANFTLITTSQWQQYEDKYGKLMWKIARRISGDAMIASLEDNYSDLCIAAMDSIAGFKKKTGMEFDQMIKEKLFDGYTKTVLWHHKAKKGVALTANMENLNKTWSIHKEEDSASGTSECDAFQIEDKRSYNDLESMAIKDLFSKQSNEVKAIIEALRVNPCLVSKDGKIKISSVSKETGLSLSEVRNNLERIQRICQ